jgi:hypothetical protein
MYRCLGKYPMENDCPYAELDECPADVDEVFCVNYDNVLNAEGLCLYRDNLGCYYCRKSHCRYRDEEYSPE